MLVTRALGGCLAVLVDRNDADDRAETDGRQVAVDARPLPAGTRHVSCQMLAAALCRTTLSSRVEPPGAFGCRRSRTSAASRSISKYWISVMPRRPAGTGSEQPAVQPFDNSRNLGPMGPIAIAPATQPSPPAASWSASNEEHDLILAVRRPSTTLIRCTCPGHPCRGTA